MPDTTALDGAGACWKCGQPRDLFGDGTRKCTVCHAGDEPGWQSSPVVGVVR